jgi:hypothetical protein
MGQAKVESSGTDLTAEETRGFHAEIGWTAEEIGECHAEIDLTAEE